MYGSNWKALDQKEFMKFLDVMYKCRSENTSQLWSKEDGKPIFSEIMSRERHQRSLRLLRFNDANARKNKSNDKLEPIRNLFEK